MSQLSIDNDTITFSSFWRLTHKSMKNNTENQSKQSVLYNSALGEDT